VSWANVHKERAAEQRDWMHSTIVLLREVGRLRDKRRISEREYVEITMKTNPDCSWNVPTRALDGAEERGNG
jgi:ribosomal protein L19E